MDVAVVEKRGKVEVAVVEVAKIAATVGVEEEVINPIESVVRSILAPVLDGFKGPDTLPAVKLPMNIFAPVSGPESHSSLQLPKSQFDQFS